MLIPTFPTILADIEGFFGIVFFLIAFVGWVINLVNQNQEANKRKSNPSNRPERVAPKKNVQSEIDQFLKQSQRSTKRSYGDEPEDVEVIAPPRRRPPQRRRRTREEIIAEQTGQKPHAPKPQNVDPVAITMSQRREERLNEAKKKSAKKTSQERSKLAKQIDLDLPHSVNQHVSTYMDQFAAESPTSSGQIGIASTTRNHKTKASVIGQLLRSKSGVRNAVILQEILSPPKGLRR